MHEKPKQWLYLSAYSFVFTSYVVVGLVAAHPFDDVIYAVHAQYFYYMSVNPVFNLSMGLYYELINIGGYFVTVVLALAGISNVLTIQIGVKIPFILFTFLAAYFLYRIIEHMGLDGRYASLLLLTSPIYFFTSMIYGSALVVSVFFSVASIYFLFERRTLFSAVLFGMSVGTYLYPVFSFPFLLRYLNKEYGRRITAFYAFIAVLFAAIGQLTVLAVYYKTGYSIPSSAPTAYLPSNTIPYYSVFDILNIFGFSDQIPGVTYSYVYYASSFFASFSYFLLKREHVNRESLVAFFLIQGVLFSALNPYNLPSYMAAMIPFGIILAMVDRRWIFIGMMWISSFLSFMVMQTISSVGFLIYFSDVNLRIFDLNSNFPGWLNSIVGFLYSLSLLAFIPMVLRPKVGKSHRFAKSVLSQFSVISVLVVVAILILIPVVNSVPGNMYYSDQMNTFQAQPLSESLLGNSLVVEYSVPVVGFLSENYLNNFIGYFEIPSTQYVIYNTSKTTTLSAGLFRENITFNYPIQNGRMELFGTEKGSVNVSLSNKTAKIYQISTIVASKEYEIYRYAFNTTLSGSYTMDVNSNISLYSQGNDTLSIFFSAYPATGKVKVGSYVISGNYVPGNLLKSKLALTFLGPFKEFPPYEPSFLVYLAKNFVVPAKSALFEGGVTFVSLILIPPSVIFYYNVKKRTRRRTSVIR